MKTDSGIWPTVPQMVEILLVPPQESLQNPDRYQGISDDQTGYNNTYDAHQLDQNIQARPTGVLERINVSVAQDRRFMSIGVLPPSLPAPMNFLVLSLEPTGFDMKIVKLNPQHNVHHNRLCVPSSLRRWIQPWDQPIVSAISRGGSFANTDVGKPQAENLAVEP